MSIRSRLITLVVFTFAAHSIAHSQAAPTANQELRLSAFGGATGTYTGLGNGKNIGITAGADLAFGSYFGLHPAIEGRGTYPIHDGSVDSQKNFLFGLKVEKRYRRFNPYVDFLFGRGETDYADGGYLNPSGTLYYVASFSSIFSPGAGVDIELTHHYALKIDGQFQHYQSPVTTSGSLYAKALTVGAIYRFDFNHHPKVR